MVPCLTFDGNRSYYGALSTDSASAVALMDFWGGRCPLTGITHPRLLRASHMKPWSACTDAAERLNVHNGLLLAAHLDAAFDAGLITFGGDGALMISQALSASDRRALHLDESRSLAGLKDDHLPFLIWHREWVFAAT